jgi:hypothetical protein
VLDICTYKKIEKDMFVLVPGITKEQLQRACLPAVATAMSPRCILNFYGTLVSLARSFFFLVLLLTVDASGEDPQQQHSF